MLVSYYRGRTSFVEMMNLPLSYINTLYKIAEERNKDEEERQKHEAEILEDEMEAAIT